MTNLDLEVRRHLIAVHREVTVLEHEEHSGRIVGLKRSFVTSTEDLWDAITNPKRIVHWFLPISGELKIGGRFKFEGNAEGFIVQCVPRSRLVVTWEFGGDVSRVEVLISKDEFGVASLTLNHMMVFTDHWREYGPGATGVGWEMALLGLDLHLTRPNEPKLDEATFHTTPMGRSLLLSSSDLWGHAAIEAGTDPEVARGAADRTKAFYTGEPLRSE